MRWIINAILRQNGHDPFGIMAVLITIIEPYLRYGGMLLSKTKPTTKTTIDSF